MREISRIEIKAPLNLILFKKNVTYALKLLRHTFSLTVREAREILHIQIQKSHSK